MGYTVRLETNSQEILVNDNVERTKCLYGCAGVVDGVRIARSFAFLAIE
jgi:hypothetical protein